MTALIPNLIAGTPRGGQPVRIANPATLQPAGHAPAATPTDLDDAVGAARTALRGDWRDAALRRHALAACADRIDQHTDSLAALLSAEQGKPLAGARVECAIASRILRHYARYDEPDTARLIRASAVEHVSFDRLPVGVCALVVPWNFPIAILFMKLGPALRAGNTVVIKPAPSTPLSTLRLVSLLGDLLPSGVVNTVTGGAEMGAALSAHPQVAKVSFTGSTATGRAVMASAAQTLKRLTLELGGNDPAIVLPDADPDRTATRLFGSAFSNAGQVCAAVKRVYVHRSLHDALVERLESLARGLQVGAGDDPAAQMGPVHSAAQREIVAALTERAAQDGARVFRDGPDLPALPGHFLRPAIVSGIAHDAPLVAREQFGPALPVVAFDTEDQALAMANDSAFGLGASVWSADETRALTLARGIEAGSLYINAHAVPPDPAIPFGGAKQSGIGQELGDWAIDEYTLRRVIRIERPQQSAQDRPQNRPKGAAA